ncbi:MAG: indolepyruvate ferredoxin oxidoreductase [Thermoanaerobaculia bacterium]
MTAQPLLDRPHRVLLGDEAVALAALDAGVTAAYAYPGTPSTEILEFLLRLEGEPGAPHAAWCVNEKTALEQALGVSMAGGRSLVAMKHVGLNVAADPFMNAALVAIRGGLVVAVADDPGMHSSQNEQDSRIYADFAHVPCFDPATLQEAYDMTREAFEVSERFHVPVMVRLVTRLAHSRAVLHPAPSEPPRPLSRRADPAGWVLLPANARRRWHRLLELQDELREHGARSAFNRLTLSGERGGLGVITTGIARNYLEENLEELAHSPSHLHVGAYPWPVDAIRALADHVDEILVLEEGYSFLERHLRGLLPGRLPVRGKESGDLPVDGELTPDLVRAALGLPARPRLELTDFPVPARPPQLCRGCPHQDAFHALRLALEGIEGAVVPSDIGCYTLGLSLRSRRSTPASAWGPPWAWPRERPTLGCARSWR